MFFHTVLRLFFGKMPNGLHVHAAIDLDNLS